jgi:hypothetical protein
MIFCATDLSRTSSPAPGFIWPLSEHLAGFLRRALPPPVRLSAPVASKQCRLLRKPAQERPINIGLVISFVLTGLMLASGVADAVETAMIRRARRARHR